MMAQRGEREGDEARKKNGSRGTEQDDYADDDCELKDQQKRQHH